MGLTVTAVMILLFYAFAGVEGAEADRAAAGRTVTNRNGAERVAAGRAVANRNGAERAAADRAIADRGGASRIGPDWTSTS